MALTLADALTHLRSRLDEATASFWSDTELTRWINEGAQDLARRTESLRDETDLAVLAGVQEVTAPTDLIRATGLEWRPTSTGQHHPMQYRDRHNADAVWGSGDTEGSPIIWTSWGFPPALTLRVFPTPHEAGNLHLYYYRLPALVTTANTSAIIEVPSGWDDLVVEYATMLAFRKDGNQQWRDSFQHYEQRVNDLLATAIRYNDQAGYIDQGFSPLAPMWLYEGSEW